MSTFRHAGELILCLLYIKSQFKSLSEQFECLNDFQNVLLDPPPFASMAACTRANMDSTHVH